MNGIKNGKILFSLTPNEILSVGIIGGGISGATIALQLSELGHQVILFEKNENLLNGPPMCHLHAGGNFYRELSDAECSILLNECIEFSRLYPSVIEHRPTVFAVPKRDNSNPEEFFPRLKKLQYQYQKLVDLDPKNKVFGEPKDYYRVYYREQLEHLRLNKQTITRIESLDDWIVAVAKHVDLDALKMPLILVQEYGLNRLHLTSLLTSQFSQKINCMIKTRSIVTHVKRKEKSWHITYIHNGRVQQERCDYLINAAGFRTGIIDDCLGIKRDSMIEFKAAYLAKWTNCSTQFWPEMVFHGKRGTPEGMAQLTPYLENYFLLHGMTKDITLFDDGLVKNTVQAAQPKLPLKYIKKIDHGWTGNEVRERSQRAITHVAHFIPSFSSATPCDISLFGAQQIPGHNPAFRNAIIYFGDGEYSTYARCQIVKASSALTAYNQIIANMEQQGLVANFSVEGC